jgi:hypothetical protein
VIVAAAIMSWLAFLILCLWANVAFNQMVEELVRQTGEQALRVKLAPRSASYELVRHRVAFPKSATREKAFRLTPT